MLQKVDFLAFCPPRRDLYSPQGPSPDLQEFSTLDLPTFLLPHPLSVMGGGPGNPMKEVSVPLQSFYQPCEGYVT